MIYRTIERAAPVLNSEAPNTQLLGGIYYQNNPNIAPNTKSDSAIHLNDLGIVIFVLLVVVLILLFMLWRMDRNRLEEALRNR